MHNESKLDTIMNIGAVKIARENMIEDYKP